MGCRCKGNKNRRVVIKKRPSEEVVQPSQQDSANDFGSTLSGNTPNEQAHTAPKTPDRAQGDSSVSS